MNGSIELTFHVDANKRKLRIIYLNNFKVAVEWAWDSSSNGWINLAEFLHANTYLRKLEITLIVIGLPWSNMGVSF